MKYKSKYTCRKLKTRRKNKRSVTKRSVTKRSVSKRSINKRSVSKRRQLKTHKRSHLKKGGSHSYDMDSGEYKTIDDGKEFFRKILSTNEENNNELTIVNFLVRFPDYKDNNIVTFYEMEDSTNEEPTYKDPKYIDMEELSTQYTDPDYSRKYIENAEEREKQIKAMRQAKDFLQDLGIMYLDWKFDNIGKSKDSGKYKLFDFDASGIANMETGQWVIEPIYLNTYGRAKASWNPKDLDDYLFEKELVERPPPISY